MYYDTQCYSKVKDFNPNVEAVPIRIRSDSKESHRSLLLPLIIVGGFALFTFRFLLGTYNDLELRTSSEIRFEYMYGNRDGVFQSLERDEAYLINNFSSKPTIEQLIEFNKNADENGIPQASDIKRELSGRVF